MIWSLLIVLSLVLLFIAWQKPPDPLAFIRPDERNMPLKTTSALNLSALAEEPAKARFKNGYRNFRMRVGEYYRLKVVVFLGMTTAFCVAVDPYLPAMPFVVLWLLTLMIFSVVVVRGVQAYERRQFDASFPNALNMLSGAVSSGESLMHAIIFVGDSLQGVVGKEFKLMGQRLSMGQAPDEVLTRSCHRFPYAPFYFFVITLRANINRGGQLKEIIRNLNQVMFNSEALQKKKNALTSEARMSAKIVAAIPLCFLILMKFMSPDNYDFVMNDPAGQPILYYVLLSEAIGLSIIWLLMKRVER